MSTTETAPVTIETSLLRNRIASKSWDAFNQGSYVTRDTTRSYLDIENARLREVVSVAYSIGAVTFHEVKEVYRCLDTIEQFVWSCWSFKRLPVAERTNTTDPHFLPLRDAAADAVCRIYEILTGRHRRPVEITDTIRIRTR